MDAAAGMAKGTILRQDHRSYTESIYNLELLLAGLIFMPWDFCSAITRTDCHACILSAPLQVLAGHYSWAHVLSRIPHNKSETVRPSCLTVFRNPVERIRSCYYFYKLNPSNCKSCQCFSAGPCGTFAFSLLKSTDASACMSTDVGIVFCGTGALILALPVVTCRVGIIAVGHGPRIDPNTESIRGGMSQ